MGDAAFWAGKRLGILSRYRSVPAEAAGVEADRIGLPLESGERLLGIYANPPGTVQTAVAVTSAAIATATAGGWDRMRYADLSVVRFTGGKGDWDRVTLAAADGSELDVYLLDDLVKPVTDLSGYLLKVSRARRVFDRDPQIRVPALAHHE